MTAIVGDNMFGFYANFNFGEVHQELVKQYLWGDGGLKEQLKTLKWQTYGQDFHLILFEFYVQPISSLRDALKEIGRYRRKEKAIGIPVILDQENFFKLNEVDRLKFLHLTILSRLELLKEKVTRSKLHLNIEKLKSDSGKLLEVNDKKATT
jgi:hypothetical protein